jgi:hypothetical protein
VSTGVDVLRVLACVNGLRVLLKLVEMLELGELELM